MQHMERERYFMRIALDEARMAFYKGEVPVGAIITDGDTVVARAHNQSISMNDPTAHAEILAIREAGRIKGNYRLNGMELFVTIEPCVMCASALMHARIARLYYGARDPKMGGVESLYSILSDKRLNHRIEVKGGIIEDECLMLIREFFRERRRR